MDTITRVTLLILLFTFFAVVATVGDKVEALNKPVHLSTSDLLPIKAEQNNDPFIQHYDGTHVLVYAPEARVNEIIERHGRKLFVLQVFVNGWVDTQVLDIRDVGRGFEDNNIGVI
jgi:hypothetical protein